MDEVTAGAEVWMIARRLSIQGGLEEVVRCAVGSLARISLSFGAPLMTSVPAFAEQGLCFTAGCHGLPRGCHQAYCPQYRQSLPPSVWTRPVQRRDVAPVPLSWRSVSQPLSDETLLYQREDVRNHPRETEERQQHRQIATAMGGLNVVIMDADNHHTTLTRPDYGAMSHISPRLAYSETPQLRRPPAHTNENLRPLPSQPRLTPGRANAVETGMIERRSGRPNRGSHSAPASQYRFGGHYGLS